MELKESILDSRATRKSVTIYTDGACKGNPGPGAYAAILIYGKHQKEIIGSFRWTTNNRMEIMGLIAAIATLKEPCTLSLFTDSKYLVSAFENNWIRLWKRNGWITRDKLPVLNKDLWLRLDAVLHLHTFAFHWVKGHAIHKINNRCDQLAVDLTRAHPTGIDEAYEAIRPMR